MRTIIAYKVQYTLFCVRIAGGSDNVFGFIHKDINLCFSLESFAVETDIVGSLDLRAEFGDDISIDSNKSC